jgi:hypothetical protein
LKYCLLGGRLRQHFLRSTVRYRTFFTERSSSMTTCRGAGYSILLLAAIVSLPMRPLAAQVEGNSNSERYLRLDDGLYELNADGTYHKVEGNGGSGSRQPTPSRPAAGSSSGQYSANERFMRLDDGLYERGADGTYTKVDERRMQQQSQSGGSGASSTSNDPRWQQQYGGQDEWDDGSRRYNRPPQWNNNQQQWSNNRPQQWNNNQQQWSNNNKNQNDLRQLGIFLNALGNAIENGNGGGQQQGFQQQGFQQQRPPRPNNFVQPQPRPPRPNNNFVQPQPRPQFQIQEPRPVPQPQPQPQPQVVIQPPQPNKKAPAVDRTITDAIEKGGMNLTK